MKAFNYFTKKAMKVYADSPTEAAVRRDFYYAFADTKYPGIPEFEMNTITTAPFIVGNIPVIPIEVLAFKHAGFGISVWQVHLHHRCQFY